MSYILDALRRADAERQRGGVPGLHAQPAAPMRAGADSAPRFGPVALGLIGVGLLLVGGAAAWWLGVGRGGAAPVALTPPAVAPTAVLTVQPVQPVPATRPAQPAAPGAGLASAPAAVVPSPAAEPARRQVSPPPATLPLPAPLPLRLPSATAVPAPMPSKTLPATTAPPTPPPPAGRAAAARPGGAPVPPIGDIAAGSTVAPVSTGSAAPAVAALPARVPRLAELPEGLRRELPALSLGGSVFADQPAARIVIINGQVYREGERPAPGLLVQQIGLRAVIFEFRGQRFEVPL